ncbi:MAG: NAD(P)/FAD-dependent oxidoreductase [Rubrivivax sp.]
MPSRVFNSSSSGFDVVVAGAGVVGASVAWHAARRGMRVAVLDAVGPAAAASGASDGAVSVASKRPGPLARLAGESLRYCRETLSLPGGPLHRVFEVRPSYFFATDDIEHEALDGLVAKLGEVGAAVRIGGDHAQPRRVLPMLSQAVRRLVVVEGEGHMLGYAATAAYLEAADVERVWPAAIDGFRAGGAGVAVDTTAGTVHTRHLVLALGLGTRKLFPKAPLIPRAGQLAITDARRAGADALPGSLTAAAYLASKSIGRSAPSQVPIVIDPLATGQVLVGSSREPHEERLRTDLSVLRPVLERAVQVYPALGARRLVRAFAGVRAAVDDGLPLLGPLAACPGVWLATGFEGDGICLSALAGRELAAMIAGGSAHADLECLAPERYGQAWQAVVS